jgi:hypothetical protein
LTIVVLGLLAVVWIAVLAPPLLRKGAETRKADSIGDFRRQLVVLQRTGPTVIAPANTRVDHRFGAPAAAYTGPTPAPAPVYAAPVGAVARVPRRSREITLSARRRRRNVLLTLTLTTLLLVVLGALPGMHLLLAVAAVSAVLLAAYVALLVRLRNAAAEREMKLSFLPGPAAYAAPGAPLLRRSAN